MTVQNNFSKTLFLEFAVVLNTALASAEVGRQRAAKGLPLMVPALSFLSSGEAERGHSLRPDGKT
jgi:hypothetical protein